MIDDVMSKLTLGDLMDQLKCYSKRYGEDVEVAIIVVDGGNEHALFGVTSTGLKFNGIGEQPTVLIAC